MSPSLTSVVIPTYNRSGYLPLAIWSALAQEGAEVEVIVVDDGFADDTADVVKRLKTAWGERVRYLWQGANRQRGRGAPVGTGGKE